jgi:hypothetical protein
MPSPSTPGRWLQTIVPQWLAGFCKYLPLANIGQRKHAAIENLYGWNGLQAAKSTLDGENTGSRAIP